MEERVLVQKAQQGDRQAFCTLYGLYKDRFYRYALYRLGHAQDAEDAVSDCVLELWRRITSLRDPAAFAAFAFRILYASCAGRIREQIERRGESNIETAVLPETMRREDQTDMHLILEESLGTLSGKEREIVLLSAVSGLTSGEIADITGMTAGAVRSNLARSLNKLRSQLKP